MKSDGNMFNWILLKDVQGQKQETPVGELLQNMHLYVLTFQQ